MNQSSRGEREAARAAAEVARRAIRRLDILEWVLFAGAFAVAILGGWAVSRLIVPPTSSRFRMTWIVTSLLLFVVPGGVTIIRMRRAERRAKLEGTEHRTEDDG